MTIIPEKRPAKIYKIKSFNEWLNKKGFFKAYYSGNLKAKESQEIRNKFNKVMRPNFWKKYLLEQKIKNKVRENKTHATRIRESIEHNYREKYRLQKIEAMQLLGGKCQRCGYEECAGALQFHHIDPKDKWNKTTSSGVNSDFERFKKDIKKGKLLLLCANCHFEKHRGFW